MGQGLIGGVLWGALAAGVGLVVASQVAAPPGQAGPDMPAEVAAESPAKAPATQPAPVTGTAVATADPVPQTPVPAASPAPDPAPPVPQLAAAPPPDVAPELPAVATADPADAAPLPEVVDAAPDATPKIVALDPAPSLPAATPPEATAEAAVPPKPDPATDVAAATPAPGAKFVQAPPKPAAETATRAVPPKVDAAAPAAVVANQVPASGTPTLPAPTTAPARATLPASVAATDGPLPVPPWRPAATATATVVVTEAPPAAALPQSVADQGNGAPAPVVTARAGFQPDLIAPAPEADLPPVTGALPPPPPLTPEEMALAADAAALPAEAADPALPEIIVLSETTDPAAPSILRKPKPLAPTPSLTAKGKVQATRELPKAGTVADPAEAGAAVPEVTLPEDALPIDRYARPFENAAGKPLFSIVLIDTGGPLLDREALAAMPFPVTFVLDPTQAGADLAASIYREAGQEVAMLATGLPKGATAADIEVSFAAHAAALPEAVAVLDPETGGFQGDRPLSTLVVPVVKGQGRGLLSWDRGLNAAAQVAQREGLRSGVIFRRLDGEGEPKAQIRRYLDRAAFKAAQDGRVIVAGETRPDTVAALLEWAVEGRAATVALAPLSAALRLE